MVSAYVCGSILTEYVTGFIACKARALCRYRGFTRSDAEDLAQELTLSLLEKEHQYDPTRGASIETFAVRVVKTHIAEMLRSRSRLKRAGDFASKSLDGTMVVIDGLPVDLASATSQSDDTRIPRVRCDEALANAQMNEILEGLPPELIEIATRLQEESLNSIEESMNLNRRQMTEAKSTLRRHLEKLGLAPNGEIPAHSFCETAYIS